MRPGVFAGTASPPPLPPVREAACIRGVWHRRQRLVRQRATPLYQGLSARTAGSATCLESKGARNRLKITLALWRERERETERENSFVCFFVFQPSSSEKNQARDQMGELKQMNSNKASTHLSWELVVLLDFAVLAPGSYAGHRFGLHSLTATRSQPRTEISAFIIRLRTVRLA